MGVINIVDSMAIHIVITTTSQMICEHVYVTFIIMHIVVIHPHIHPQVQSPKHQLSSIARMLKLKGQRMS